MAADTKNVGHTTLQIPVCVCTHTEFICVFSAVGREPSLCLVFDAEAWWPPPQIAPHIDPDQKETLTHVLKANSSLCLSSFISYGIFN